MSGMPDRLLYGWMGMEERAVKVGDIVKRGRASEATHRVDGIERRPNGDFMVDLRGEEGWAFRIRVPKGFRDLHYVSSYDEWMG